MEAKHLFVALVCLFQLSVALCLTTPVPILKQLNRQNEDGSYSYGYENADGSYKIETKSATGDIVGKYGYVDETGKLREIEYKASKTGFEPAGPGIEVAPPTLQNENSIDTEYDDGQYREDPSIYYKTEKPLTKLAPKFSSTTRTNPSQVDYRYQSPQFIQQPQRQQFAYQPQQFAHQPQQFAPNYNVNPAVFRGHPASNVDLYSGSYTVEY